MSEGKKIEFKIDEDYSIALDSNCYVLVHYATGKRAKTGEEFLARYEVGYFYTISDACRGYIREIERNAVLDGSVRLVNDFLGILSEKEKTLRENLSTAVKTAFESVKRGAA